MFKNKQTKIQLCPVSKKLTSLSSKIKRRRVKVWNIVFPGQQNLCTKKSCYTVSWKSWLQDENCKEKWGRPLPLNKKNNPSKDVTTVKTHSKWQSLSVLHWAVKQETSWSSLDQLWIQIWVPHFSPHVFYLCVVSDVGPVCCLSALCMEFDCP